MNDHKMIVDMLLRAGIRFGDKPRDGGGSEIVIDESAGPKWDGYTGFAVSITFDEHGNLEKIGAWE